MAGERPKIIAKRLVNGNKIDAHYTNVSLPTPEVPRNSLDIRTLTGDAYDGRELIIILAEKPSHRMTDRDHSAIAQRSAQAAYERMERARLGDFS